MGIYDRDYMRRDKEPEAGGWKRKPLVKVIIAVGVICVFIWLAQGILG